MRILVVVMILSFVLAVGCQSKHPAQDPGVEMAASATGSLKRDFSVAPMPRFAPTEHSIRSVHTPPQKKSGPAPIRPVSKPKTQVMGKRPQTKQAKTSVSTSQPTTIPTRQAKSFAAPLQTTPPHQEPAESIDIAKLSKLPLQEKTSRDARWVQRVQQFYGSGRQFLLVIQTDKPLYQPGETIWVRAVGIKRKENTTHLLPESATYHLKGPRQQTIRKTTVPVYAGHSQYGFALPYHAVGGEYTVEIQHNQTKARSTHKITVQTYQTPQIQKKLVFIRKGYGPGDTVHATLIIKRATGEPLAQHSFQVSAQLAGKTFRTWTQTSSAQGESLIQFALPQHLDTDDGLLIVQVAYGGARESIARAIPLQTRNLLLGFFPEGGQAALDLPNRVYFACRRKRDAKPQDIEGDIIDQQDQVVAQYHSFHDGMGRFLYTPRPEHRYFLRIRKPVGISETFPLPQAQPRKLSIQAVDDFSSKHRDIRILVHSQNKRSVVVAAMQYETVIGHARFLLQPGQQLLTLPLQKQWRGIVRLTLFDGQYETPLLERLFFRHRGKGLQFQFMTPQETYRPQDTVHVKIRVKTPDGNPLEGATLGVAVVDQTVLTYADDHEPHFLAQRYLSTQLTGTIHKPNFYFDPQETKALRALDLVMGTHGWRDFDWKQIQKGTKPPAIAQLLASNAPRPLSGMRWTHDVQKTPTILMSPAPDVAEKQATVDSEKKNTDTTERKVAIAESSSTPKQEKSLDSTAVITQTPVLRRKQNREPAPQSAPAPPTVQSKETDSRATRVMGRKHADPNLRSRFYDKDNSVEQERSQDPQPTKTPDRTRRSLRKRRAQKEDHSISGGGKTAGMGMLGGIGISESGSLGHRGVGRGGGGLGRRSLGDDAQLPSGTSSPRAKTKWAAPSKPVGGGGPGYARYGLGNYATAGGYGSGRFVPFRQPSRVYHSQPTVYGSLHRNTIARIIRQRTSRFRYIYERGLQRNPNLGGKVLIRFRIAETGKVDSVQLGGSALLDLTLRRQIVQTVRRMRFPRPIGRGHIFVSYPLLFKPADSYGSRWSYRRPYRAYPPYIAWSYPRSFPVFFYQKVDSQAQIERKDFRETIFWHPHLKTDAWGEVNVSFGLNDSVTSFQVQATGLGHGYLGQAHHTLRSTRPFHLTVRTPIAVSSGDAMVLPVTLDNETQKPLRIRVISSLSSHFRLQEDPLPGVLSLGAQQSKTYYYPIRVIARHGQGSIQIAVRGGGFSDAIQRKIMIRERGYPQNYAWSGTLQPNQSLSKTITLPKNIEHLRGQLVLETNPMSSWENSLHSMLREPYGCFEQTSSVNYPNILILRYLSKRGVSNPHLFRRAYGLLERGYQRLMRYESQGGGFEWFGASPGHEALTAYGLLQFLEMKKVYPRVDSTMIQRTQSWLLSRRNGEGGYRQSERSRFGFRAGSMVNDVYITYALTMAGVRNLHKEVHYAAQQALDGKDPYLLALALQAHHRIRRKHPLTRQLQQALLQQQQQDGSFRSRGTSITQSYGNNLHIETTALAALAMMHTDTSPSYIHASLRWLRQQRNPYGGFGTTQATVQALQALTTWEERYPTASGPGTLKVWLHDQLVHTERLASNAKPVSLQGSWIRSLRPGSNVLRLEWQAPYPVPFGLGLSYRTYQPVTHKQAPISIHTSLQQDRVRMGEVVRLHATIQNNTAKPLPMVLAKIAIPGNLQWQNWQLKQWKEQGTIAFYETQPRTWIVYFRSMQPGETKKLHLDLDALVTGHYTGTASSAYLYYSPQQKHWDAPLRVLASP